MQSCASAATPQGWQHAERRDRLIWSMHREGRTQEAIGQALEVPQRTVAHVIERISQTRDAAQTAKPKLRSAPPAVPERDAGSTAIRPTIDAAAVATVGRVHQ